MKTLSHLQRSSSKPRVDSTYNWNRNLIPIETKQKKQKQKTKTIAHLLSRSISTTLGSTSKLLKSSFTVLQKGHLLLLQQDYTPTTPTSVSQHASNTF